MTVIAWGGDGASGDGLTWPAARRGRVQGFPCRHYGRCVLDEHIAKRPMPTGAHSPQKAKCIEAERNGREQKSPDGRPRGRVCLFRLASERPPVFPIFFPQGGKVSSLTEARLRKQGVATMKRAHPLPRNGGEVDRSEGPRRRGGLFCAARDATTMPSIASPHPPGSAHRQTTGRLITA